MRESYRKHEVAFCAEVSKWADKLFETNLALPFGSSDIESFGRGSQKRQDLRVYERKAQGRSRLEELARERAGTDKLREQVVDQLNRWFIHGRQV